MREPPWLNDPQSLVVIDWSWWCNKAFFVSGVEGMMANLIGWLTSVLAYDPAHLAIAIDARGETDRHRFVHPSDPDWKYKAGRDPKPGDFYTVMDRATEIAELHSIPVLWADYKEADDIMATVATRARAAGYRVWLCTDDKDMAALCEESDEAGILCGMWDNFDDTYRGPEDIIEKFGVSPSQIADFLAICGDIADNIPGVPGLGKESAADLLRTFKTLERALSAPPVPDDAIEAVEAQVKELAKIAKKHEDPKERERAAAHRVAVMHGRSVARLHRKLVAHTDVARFSRSLTALDYDVPLDIPWNDLPIGDYKVSDLRAKYMAMGYTRKANDVPSFRKREAWVIPHEER